MKKCNDCGKTKPISEYHKRSNRPCGHIGRCNICERIRVKRNRQSLAGRYSMYKQSAKQKDREFFLTKEDFKKMWNQPCAYCGGEIKGIGIDRVLNSEPYVLSNVVSCCYPCNLMKRMWSVKDFLSHISKIFNHNFSTAK